MGYSKMEKAQSLEEIVALQEKAAELERAQAKRKRAGQAIPARRICLLVAGMFVLLCVLAWLNEILDLPRLLLGAPQTPINWREALIETILIASVGLYVVSRLIRDITERKRVEEALRQVNRALRVLSECNQAVVRATEESRLLHEICQIIVEVGGYRLAWVGYAEQDEAKSVRPVAQVGYEEEYLDTVNITWADTERGRGPTGTAIRTGEPAIAQNILTEPKFAPWREAAIKRGYASSIALPLIANGQTLGALNIYATEPGAFGAEEVKLLTELANDLAYGISALRIRTERKRAEEQVQASLREKEVLLREIHHRVKNNLQVISSLLDMRSMRTDDRQAIDFFTDARAKVHTMAMIHAQLYRSERFDQIDMGSHVRELVNYLAQVYTTKSRLITPVIEPSDVYLAITQAIPCALILNEVISNAFKHAFQEGQKGTIEVAVQRSADDTVLLRIKDDGVGLPEGIDFDKADTLGLKLISNLAQEQLKGTIQVKRDRGTEFIIEFPVLGTQQRI